MRGIARRCEAFGSAAWGVLVAGLVMRLILLPLPGFDVKDFRLWTAIIGEHGLTRVYEARVYPAVNYPPLSLYFFWAVGEATQATVQPEAEYVIASPPVLKLLPVGADLITAAVVLLFLRRSGTRSRSAAVWAALYLFHPAVLWNSAYWGGIDAVDALLALVALVALAAGRTARGWVAGTAAVLAKPLVAPILVLLAWRSWSERRETSLWRPLLLAAGTAALLYLPWLLTGRLGSALGAMGRNVGNYAVLSANAHNLWWVLSGGDGWRPDSGGLPILSYRAIGLLALGLAAYWVIHNLPRLWTPSQLLHAGGYLLLALPMLLTEAHENWAFAALAPLTVACALDTRLRPVFILLSTTVLVNLASHDPHLGPALGNLWTRWLAYPLRLGNALGASALFLYWTARLPAWLASAPESP